MKQAVSLTKFHGVVPYQVQTFTSSVRFYVVKFCDSRKHMKNLRKPPPCGLILVPSFFKEIKDFWESLLKMHLSDSDFKRRISGLHSRFGLRPSILDVLWCPLQSITAPGFNSFFFWFRISLSSRRSRHGGRRRRPKCFALEVFRECFGSKFSVSL